MIELKNNDMWWSLEDPGGYDYQVHHNENFVDRFIPYLNNNRVAVQAGGHCGYVPREMQKYFTEIYTFEPDPINFFCLCLNVKDNEKSTVHKLQAAVGNSHGIIGQVKSHMGSGAYYVDTSNDNPNKNIPTFLIDDLALESCDFIQLDLEGYEYNALLGAERTIAEFKPLLCLEVCDPRVEESCQHNGSGYFDRFGATIELLETFLIGKLGYKEVDRGSSYDEWDRVYKYDGE